MLGLERGANGFNPGLRVMSGIFFAMGRGTAAEKTDNVHPLDIAPTVADILGILGSGVPARVKNRWLSLANDPVKCSLCRQIQSSAAHGATALSREAQVRL